MKKTLLIAASTVALSMAFTGCAMNSVNIPMKNMEKSEYTDPIVNGKTTKADVQKLLGDPNHVHALSGAGNEGKITWEYMHTRGSYKFISYIPVLNWFKSGTDDTTKQLSIVFDKNGVVENHDTTKFEGETVRGLFQ